MEFLRFGSSIPGGYWGCCAVCIIQNFKFDPDAKASIQLVSGDNGTGLTKDGEAAFVGTTYREIFEERLRIGTFSSRDMPNHTFFAVLTETQVSGGVGKKWMEILKAHGFEFIRTVDNSVYTGAGLDGSTSPHKSHVFGLFRNISGSRVADPFTPPAGWTSLPKVIPEPFEFLDAPAKKALAEGQTKVHKKAWIDHGPTKILKESEVVAAGAPVTLAGRRMPFAAPELKSSRDARESKTVKADPFASKTKVKAEAAVAA